MTRNWILALSFILIGCSQEQPSAPISGRSLGIHNGFKVGASSPYRSLAAVLRISRADGDSWCTISPIASDAGAVSAHCLNHDDIRQLKAYFFMNNTMADVPKWPTEYMRDIVHSKMHPQFTTFRGLPGQSNPYDIAVLVFNSDMPQGMNYFSVAPNAIASVQHGQVALLGYGYEDAKLVNAVQNLEDGVGEMALRFTIQPLKPRDQAEMFRLDGRKSSSCAGDSGGPVFSPSYRDYQHPPLVAITTDRLTFTNKPRCLVDSEVVDVSARSSWIFQTLNGFRTLVTK